MPLKSLMTLFILLGASTALAYGWKTDTRPLTIKVYSCFGEEGNEDSCLEGSGVLVHGGNGTYDVYTSEHVVLPSNDLAHHKVMDQAGNVAVAKFVKSSWENGVAILNFKATDDWVNHWGDNTPYSIGEMASDRYRLEETFYPGERVWAGGYAAGSNEPTYQEGKAVSVGEMGALLAKTPVFTVSGLRAEFGMSGGPVFQDRTLMGLMTHVTFEPNPKTFVIPTSEIAEWGGGRGERDWFERTFEDFQRQYFSDSKMEVVTQRDSGMKIELREGKCLVTGTSNPGMGLDMYFAPTLGNIAHQMKSSGYRIAHVKSIAGLLCGQMSLGQFVGWLRKNVSYEAVDFEGDTNQDDPSLVKVENFTAKKGQYALYGMTETYTKPIAEYDSLGRITYVRKKFTDEGFFEAVNNYERIETTSWRSDQQRYQGDTNYYDNAEQATTETWRQRMASCEADGGKIEIIKVPYGKFRTCAVTKGDYTTWYGPVPVLGIVQKKSLSGSWMIQLRDMRLSEGWIP